MSSQPDVLLPYAGTWVGDVRGTHIGNAFAETSIQAGTLHIDIRVNSNSQITRLQGTFQGTNPVSVAVTVVEPAPGTGKTPVTGTLTTSLIGPDRMEGNWKLSNGAAGLFWLQKAQTQTTGTPRPAQIIAKETSVSALTLFRGELEAITRILEGFLPQPARVAVSAEIDGRNVTQWSSDFLGRTDLPQKAHEIKLNIADASKGRSVVVNFSRKSGNSFSVQSDDAIWTTGVSLDLERFFSRYTSRYLNFIKQYGLNINFFLFLLAIVLLPDLALARRFIFFVCVIVVMFVFVKLHSLIQSTTIFLDETKRWRWGREIPTILATVLATGAVALLSWLFAQIKTLELSTLLKLLR